MSSAKTTQSLSVALPSPTREQVGLTKLFAVCLLVPFAVISSVLTLSPNFNGQTQNSVAGELREDPFGGDILQEYVGGHIWITDQNKLYDWKHAANLQHDVQLTGFEWEASGYFPMVYPPFHYQFSSLGTNLSYRNFVVMWMFAVAIALSIASFAFLAGYREIRKGAGAWFLVAILFTPLLLGINMGQKSAILLAILTVTFILLHRERPFASGLIFGLIAFKPYMAVPIGIAMLCKKQFHFVAGSIVTLGLLIVSSLMFAPEVWADYVQMCLGMSNYISNSGYQLEHSHSLWGTTQLLLGDHNPALVKPIAVVGAIGVVTLLGRILSGPIELASTRFAFQFSSLIIATVLISPHFYTYDLTILLLPLAICGLSFDVAERINKRVLYWICITVLFGASLYVPLASQLGFQISTAILLVWMVVIAGGWGVYRDRTLAKC